MTMDIQRLITRLEGVREAFHSAVFVERDAGAALDLLAPDCVLETATGVVGARGDDVRRFLTDDLLPHLPDDLGFTRVAKIADQRRVVHETTVCFTHDRELPWLLPGVPPTHRTVEIGAVSVASFAHTSESGTTRSRVLTYRITWDRLDLMTRLGLLGDPRAAPAG